MFSLYCQVSSTFGLKIEAFTGVRNEPATAVDWTVRKQIFLKSRGSRALPAGVEDDAIERAMLLAKSGSEAKALYRLCTRTSHLQTFEFCIGTAFQNLNWLRGI